MCFISHNITYGSSPPFSPLTWCWCWEMMKSHSCPGCRPARQLKFQSHVVLLGHDFLSIPVSRDNGLCHFCSYEELGFLECHFQSFSVRFKSLEVAKQLKSKYCRLAVGLKHLNCSPSFRVGSSFFGMSAIHLFPSSVSKDDILCDFCSYKVSRFHECHVQTFLEISYCRTCQSFHQSLCME